MDLSMGYAQMLDEQDELKSFRSEFYIQPDTIYLDGNSLGLLSRPAEQALLTILDSWRTFGIDGWTEGPYPWYDLSERLGALTAPLIGAKASEVVVTGSTTVNLHQLLATFHRLRPDRTKILADDLTFPSDIYAIQSHLQSHELDPAQHLVKVPSTDGLTLDESAIIAAMTDDIAMVILPSVLYRSGQLLNLERLTAAAHERNILIGFDLAHSIGAIPHRLSESQVDFAFWCNYKYLNSGPGASAGLYVNHRHFGALPGLAGWFSSAKDVQFDLDHALTPADSAGAYQIGTPHILSTAPLIGSLTIFQEARINRIRNKSLRLTRYLMELIESELPDAGFTVGNPREDARRGGHVSLLHHDAARISKALKVEKVIPDFRPPDVIRLAPIALSTSFMDVWVAVQRLKHIMNEKRYEQFANERGVIA
jgi:kynureninase